MDVKRETEDSEHDQVYAASSVAPDNVDLPDLGSPVKSEEVKSNYKVKIHGSKFDRGGSQYVCEICGKKFISLPGLKIHYRRHLGELPFKCHFCEKAFPVVGSLRAHVRIHTGERPFSCHICGRTFVQNGSLQSHMRTHTGDRPYVCNLCGKAFTVSSSLRLHTKQHTSEAQSSETSQERSEDADSGQSGVQCSQCEKQFSNADLLEVHARYHAGARLYMCDLCGKAFTEDSRLEAHCRVHVPTPPELCLVCSKSFVHTDSGSNEVCANCEKAVADLRAERSRVNAPAEDERPYVCEFCGKSFKHRGNLHSHALGHERSPQEETTIPQESLVCRVCGHCLPSGALLEAHLRLHMNELTSACNVCGKMFASHFQMKRHVVRKHKRRHVCAQCGKSFSKRGKLLRHEMSCCLDQEVKQEPEQERIYLPVVEGTTDHL